MKNLIVGISLLQKGVDLCGSRLLKSTIGSFRPILMDFLENDLEEF